MNNQAYLTDLLRQTYIPLIRERIPEGPPRGELRWLVNKCGTQFSRIKSHNKTPITSSLQITQGIPHVLGPTRWCGRFVNRVSGNVYFISFEAE